MHDIRGFGVNLGVNAGIAASIDRTCVVGDRIERINGQLIVNSIKNIECNVVLV